MRDEQPKFEAKGIKIAVVTQGEPAQAAQLCERHKVGFTCLADAKFEAYRAYGLGRFSMMQMMSPIAALRAIGTTLRGNLPTQMGGDIFQGSGTFVIDRTGSIVMCHRNRDPSDNPAMEAIISAV